MNYIRRFLNTDAGRYITRILPFYFLLSCGNPANEVALEVDLNGDGYKDRVAATGSLLSSEYPVTVQLSGEDGKLGPPEEIGRFNERLHELRTSNRGDTVDVAVVTRTKKSGYKTYFFRNNGEGGLTGSSVLTITLPELESR